MKNTRKRIIALILAVAMCLSLLSANVWSAELEPQAEQETISAEVTEDGAESAQSDEDDSGEESNQEEESADGSVPEEEEPETDTETKASAPMGTGSNNESEDASRIPAEDESANAIEDEKESEEPETDTETKASAPMETGSNNESEDASRIPAEDESANAVEDEKESEESIRQIEPMAGAVLGSGECGDNLTWTVRDNGELRISGTGEMWKYSLCEPLPDVPINVDDIDDYIDWTDLPRPSAQGSSDAEPKEDTSVDQLTTAEYTVIDGCIVHILGGTWYDYREQITSLVIESGVTNIEGEAFSDLPNLKSVSIPGTVARIGYGAFRYCRGLLTIVIPSGVTTIDTEAFEECSALTKVDLGPTVTSIGSRAFYKCAALSNLNLGSKLEAIWNGAFCGCNSLVVVDIPASVTRIGDAAFYCCEALTTVNIPSSVTDIGDWAFRNCKALTTVTIQNKETKLYEEPQYKSWTGDDGNWYWGYVYYSHVFTDSPNVTLRAPINSKAQGFAERHNIPFEKLVSTPISACTITLSPTSYVYDGSAKQPTVTVKNGSTTLTRSTDYRLSFDENVNAGTGRVVVTGVGSYEGTAAKTFAIAKAAPVLTFSSSSVAKKTTNAAFTNTLTRKTDGTVTFQSDNTGVAAVDSSSGQVTIKGVGVATITASAAAGQNYKAGSASYSLSVSAPGSYTISYNANGGTGTPAWQTKTEGMALTLSNVTPTKSHLISYNSAGGRVSPASKSLACTFQSWNTAQNGSGTAYNPGGSYIADANATLYAQWANPKAGDLAIPVREGYDFLGWFTAANGGERVLNTTTVTRSMTVYAHWFDPYNLGDETYSFANFGDTDSENGHCFGMSVTSAGYHNGLLDIRTIGGNENTSLYRFGLTSQVKKPICYYQRIQTYDTAVKAIVAGGSSYLNDKSDISSDWKAVVNYVKNHKYDNTGSLQIGFRKNGEGGHAINFLRYEKVNGQDRIYAYDNNFPTQETYFYKSGNGSVYQAPVQTFSGAIDCITLRDIPTYFSLAGSFDDTRALYMLKDAVTVDGYSYTYMDCGNNGKEYIMYEIPRDQQYVIIVPLKDYADFIYQNAEFSFGEITENTRAKLWFSTMNDYGTGSDAKFQVYEAQSVTPDVTLSQTSFVYNGTVQKPSVSVKAKGKLLKEGRDYTVQYPSGMVKPGIYTIEVTLKGDYIGSCVANYTIKAISLSGAVITGVFDKTYTGNPINQNPVVKLNGKTLKEGTDYTICYANNTSPGTATLTVTGTGLYTGVIRKSFVIAKLRNTIRVKTSFTKTASETNAQSFKLGAKANGVLLSYKPSDKRVSVAKNGKVTIKKGFSGKVRITIKSKETVKYLPATKIVTIFVKPSVTQISSVSWDTKKKVVNVRWKKNTTGKGYEVQISLQKNFKKVEKNAVIKKNAIVKTAIKGLKKGTYYVRMRTVNGKSYSGWSKVNTLKIDK